MKGIRRTRRNRKRINLGARRRNRFRLMTFSLFLFLSLAGLFFIGKTLFFKDNIASISRSDIGGDQSQDQGLGTNSEKRELLPGQVSEKKEGFSHKLQKFYLTTEPIYLFSSTNENSSLLLEIEADQYIESYGVEGDWVKVIYDNYEGYIMNEGLSPIEEENTFKVVDGILIANRDYQLPADYNPGTSERALKSLELMEEEMARLDMKIYLISNYRSYHEQELIYSNDMSEHGSEYVEKYTAEPGHSEHQTGLAFDFNTSPDHNLVESEFKESREAEWLRDNSYKYGFILRYPRGKEDITGYSYEPWHFRYIGADNAKKIYDSGLTLEEYYDL